MSLISSAGALQALSAGAQQRVESDHIGSKLHLGYLSTKTKAPPGPLVDLGLCTNNTESLPRGTWQHGRKSVSHLHSLPLNR